jgi:hypothetical protein
MSRIKHPGEKKRHSLERDHRVFALESDKSLRSAWPSKKARANRKFRKAASKSLTHVLQAGEDAAEKLLPRRLRTLKKLGVTSLEQSIALKDDLGARWNNEVLQKNPDAIKATRPMAKPRRAK